MRTNAALRVREPAERLRAATVEHDKLLARVTRRRRARAQLEQQLREAGSRVAARIAPLADEGGRLDHELHAMFAALLGDRKRRRADKDAIRAVYAQLQEDGLITSRAPAAEPVDAPAPSASRPAADREVLRALFRRLAEAVHPDKVQDEADKVSRTELMKEITVAYQAGDFARLVEIERRWSSPGTSPRRHDGDDIERRLAAIEHATDELKRQLRQIEREIRAMRAGPEADFARELARHGDACVDLLADDAQAELTDLRRIHDFVRAFRDGKLSLDEFLAGPYADDEDEDDHDEALQLLIALAREQPRRAKRRRR